MDKFELAEMLKSAKPIDREVYISEACRGKSVLDLGCIRHSAEFALKDADWLHKKIKGTAKKVVGVDYLPEEIAKVNANGYDVVLGDVTKPLELKEKFDVIVAGDLLEHLANMEGFFSNCKMLLKQDGALIITTPNPFYCQLFHYIALKKSFMVNPEHTCWVDPLCLLQLSRRFGFAVSEAAYIVKSWPMSGLMCETKKHPYDIINCRWENEPAGFRIKRIIVEQIFGVWYFLFRHLTGASSMLCRYSDYLAVLKKIPGDADCRDAC